MIADDSILLRLPAALDRQQVLYLDGMRHAAEISGLAITRLEETLTRIAVATSRGEKAAATDRTAAFLDAWAFIDAVDRFRSLRYKMPGLNLSSSVDGQPGFQSLTQPVRDLRNVADHLATRVPYVAAHQSPALGVLTWLTVNDLASAIGYSCMLLPGTTATMTQQVVNPAGRELTLGTSMIHLAAGEYRVCLSDVTSLLRDRIGKLEQTLAAQLPSQVPNASTSGSDIVLAVAMTLGSSRAAE